jgi:Protein of unknown function (DUF2800)
MNARYPEADSAAAEEGTAAHWVLSELLNGRTVAEDTLTPNGLTVTGEMIEGAELVRVVLELQIPRGIPLHIEETVKVTPIHPDCFGTPDIWAVFDNRLVIVDYKYGHKFVEEWFNPQGLIYMLGVIAGLKAAPQIVTFIIVQPRCFYRGEPVREHTYEPIEAFPYLNSIREAAERATAPNPIATTGPHCEHCPGRHACPTLQKAAYADVETSTDQQPVELTPEAAALELKMLERALSRLTARVEGLREVTLSNLKAGKQVPHYKIERTRSRKAWTPEGEQVVKSNPKLVTIKPITPKQAELYLDKEIIQRYSHNIPGGLKMVESSTADAARVFKSKETYVAHKPVDTSRPSGDGKPL